MRQPEELHTLAELNDIFPFAFNLNKVFRNFISETFPNHYNTVTKQFSLIFSEVVYLTKIFVYKKKTLKFWLICPSHLFLIF